VADKAVASAERADDLVALAISDTTRLGSSFTIGISADHVVPAQAGVQ
jgi:hypothetical protein